MDGFELFERCWFGGWQLQLPGCGDRSRREQHDNQRDQRWLIESDSEGAVRRIRLGKYGWKDAHGNRYQLSEKPVKFYDYNF